MLQRAVRLFWNPILVKELRAGARGARFFYAHVAILSLFTLVFLLTMAALMADSSWRRTDPSQLGEQLFIITQVIQLVAVFLVVPAFAATSISSERDRQTYDLLMSTTLTPWKIAWGKLTASLIQASLIFISLMPLVSLAFIFGGITIGQMIANYLVLFAFAAVLSAWALSISASVKSTPRAVIGVYAGSVIFGIGVFALAGMLEGIGILHHYLKAYGFVGASTFESMRGWWRAKPFTPFQVLFYTGLLPTILAGGIFSFFLLNATNRLKPFFAERSAGIRLFYLAAMGMALLLGMTCYLQDIRGSGADEELVFFIVMSLLLMIGISSSSLFACEDPVLPRFLREQHAALKPLARWRLLLAPGARHGGLFCFIANLLLVLAFFAATSPFCGILAEPRLAIDLAGGGNDPWIPLAFAAAVLLIWGYMATSAGMLAGVLFRRLPRLGKVLLVSLLLLLAVLPLIYWAIWIAFERRYYRQDLPGPFVLALSPIAAILSAFHGRDVRFPMGVLLGGQTVSIHVAFGVVMAAAGTAFRLIAWRMIRGLAREAA